MDSAPLQVMANMTIHESSKHKASFQLNTPLSSIVAEVFKASRYQKYVVGDDTAHSLTNPVTLHDESPSMQGHSAYGTLAWKEMNR